MEKRKTKKVKNVKKETEIKEDIEKIIIPSFKTAHANNDVTIKAAFGITNAQAYGPNAIIQADANFTNEIMPFFYNRKIDEDRGAHEHFKSHFNDIKRRFRFALGIPQKLKEISDTIDVIDHPSNDILRQRLPRMKKYRRFEQMYDILLKFTLELIHLFAYIDFFTVYRSPAGVILRGTAADNVQIGGVAVDTTDLGPKILKQNVEQLDVYINRILPIILDLKRKLEAQVDLDYPVDIIDMTANTGQKF